MDAEWKGRSSIRMNNEEISRLLELGLEPRYISPSGSGKLEHVYFSTTEGSMPP
jgi:hypothetical protein